MKQETTHDTRIISIAENFQCLAGDCPDTCCKGWKIPVDQEAIKQYQTDTRLVKAKILNHVRGRGVQVFRKKRGQCPFYTKQGLCELQKEYGAESMPFVCREYPHKTIGYGIFDEVTLELSCPKASELLLENMERIEYQQTQKKIPVMWEIGNEDLAFLTFLEKSRKQILDYYWKEGECGDKLQMIYHYTQKVHHLIVRNQVETASEVSIEQLAEERKEVAGTNVPHQLFFPMDMVDRMITYHIAHPRLRIVNPTLHQMIRKYYKSFNDYTPQQAQDVFSDKFQEMIDKNPELLLKYQTYFSYYIQQAWLTAYEDYHILRVMLLGILYQELLMICDVAQYMQQGMPDKKTQAGMISAFEKRVRHNAGITDGIMNRIRKEFLMSQESL